MSADYLKRCAVCRGLFSPFSTLQQTCSPSCAIEHAKSAPEKIRRRAAVLERKQQRKELRQYRAKSKKLDDLLHEAQRHFNHFIRLRDEGKPCICCGGWPVGSDTLRGHLWDAGHWRSVGAAGHLRFNEDNCHRQLVRCNRDGTDTTSFRRNMIARIGPDRVEALENDNAPHKWTREEVIEIGRKYRRLCREMERKIEDQR